MSKKVLLITDHYGHGGVASVHYNLARGLKALGYEPIFVSAFIDRVGNPIPEDTGYITIHSKSWERKLFLPYIIKLARFLRQHEDAKLIISAKDHVNLFTILAKKLAFHKAPLICNSHTTVSELAKSSQWRGYRYILKACRYIYPLSDYVANVSKASAKDAKKFFRLSHVAYLPNPVIDISTIKDNKNPFKDTKRVNVLACGRLTTSKNYPLMIKAFALALKSEPKLHLTILGDGEERSTLDSLCRHYNVTENVTFKGAVNNPQSYMQHARCLWLTSLYEGFGMVLVEALAQGCPIISVDCPHGPAEIIGDNKYGQLVHSYKPKDHAKELLKFIQTPQQNREYYLQRVIEFDIVKSAKEYLELAKIP